MKNKGRRKTTKRKKPFYEKLKDSIEIRKKKRKFDVDLKVELKRINK